MALNRAAAKLDYDFGDAPEGFAPQQPLRVLPPGGSLFEAVMLLLDVFIDCANSWTLAAGGQLVFAAAMVLVLAFTLYNQMRHAMKWELTAVPGEIREVMRRGGVATERWGMVKFFEYLIEGPATGILGTYAVLWVDDLSLPQALVAILGMLFSVKAMANLAMANILGWGRPSGLRYTAAAAAVRVTKPSGGAIIRMLFVFEVIILCAQIASCAVVAKVVYPLGALVLQLPAILACTMETLRAQRERQRQRLPPQADVPADLGAARSSPTYQKSWTGKRRPPKRATWCRVFWDTLCQPLEFLAPAGSGHSPLGMLQAPRAVGWICVAQAFWFCASTIACCTPLPSVQGRAFGWFAFRREFLRPAWGLLCGGILRSDVGSALLRTWLLGLWVAGGGLFVGVVGMMLLLRPGFMAGGAAAEDPELMQAQESKQREIQQWLDEQTGRSFSPDNKGWFELAPQESPRDALPWSSIQNPMLGGFSPARGSTQRMPGPSTGPLAKNRR